MTLHDKLRALHHVDLQVCGLQSRLDARSRRLNALGTKQTQYQCQHDELADQLKHTKAQLHNFETDANATESRITELRDRMNNVTSNKEYSALLVEINTLKLEKNQVEEKALQVMTQVETLQAQVDEIDVQIADQQKLIAGAQEELTQTQSEVKDRLDALTVERDQAAAQIDPETQRVYQRLAHVHDGEVLAEIQEQNRRRMEYTCGECYMSLPIQSVNAAMSDPNALTNCPNCGRILVIATELKEAIVSK